MCVDLESLSKNKQIRLRNGRLYIGPLAVFLSYVLSLVLSIQAFVSFLVETQLTQDEGQEKKFACVCVGQIN